MACGNSCIGNACTRCSELGHMPSCQPVCPSAQTLDVACPNLVSVQCPVTEAALGSTKRMRMNALYKTAVALAAGLLASQAWAQITFYENDAYRGRSFTTAEPTRDFRRAGFNDRASSAVVTGGRWEVCEDLAYGGNCVVLRQGSYPSLAGMGLNDQLSSARPAEQRRDDRPSAYSSLPAASPASAQQITFYEYEGYQGRSQTVSAAQRDFRGTGFSDRASSAVVQGGPWEICADIAYSGTCAVLRPGSYPSLFGIGLNERLLSARPTEPRRGVVPEIAVPVPTPPNPQITFYEDEGYRGRSFTTAQSMQDFRSAGFNDRASSAVVQDGRWEVCSDAGYAGSCAMLRPGSYASLSGMGLNEQLSSARPADQRRAGVPDAPQPVASPDYDYRRRPNERLFEVPVTDVRAVVGAPTERCWIEQQQATSSSSNSNSANQTGRALLGAVIGGVLGHQIGGGTGRDLATVGGAIGGAVIGAKTGRGDDAVAAQDVRRCKSVPSTVPAYWDVSYSFQGVPHQVQMGSAPGRTITVNRFGEPRI